MMTARQVSRIRKSFNGENQRVIFKILGDKNRYRIFETLTHHPQLTVSDIANILEISVPLSSQHLKILEQGNILKKEKLGQKVFYKLQTNNRIAQSISLKVI